MTRWERLETWLFDNEPGQFTAHELADSFGVDRIEASQMIRGYLSAQRGVRASTLYVLKRQGRTSNAVWSVGQRTADARIIGQVLFDDVSVKVLRAFAPDLARLKKRNPRAARFCEMKIEAVVAGVLPILAAAVDLVIEEDGRR